VELNKRNIGWWAIHIYTANLLFTVLFEISAANYKEIWSAVVVDCTVVESPHPTST